MNVSLLASENTSSLGDFRKQMTALIKITKNTKLCTIRKTSEYTFKPKRITALHLQSLRKIFKLLNPQN